jgi:hypothetical protein
MFAVVFRTVEKMEKTEGINQESSDLYQAANKIMLWNTC